MEYEKYEKETPEGVEVAVLVSPGYGAGWSTWADDDYSEAVTFDRNIVKFVLDKNFESLTEYMKSKYEHMYLGGMEDLRVHWVAKGEAFEITEHDGYESLTVIGEQQYWVA